MPLKFVNIKYQIVFYEWNRLKNNHSLPLVHVHSMNLRVTVISERRNDQELEI